MKLPLSLTALIAFVSGAALTYIIVYIEPHHWHVIALMLTALFFSLSATSTLLFFSVTNFRKGNYLNRISIFHDSLRRGILLTTGVVTISALKVTATATLITLSLLILALAAIEWYFTQKS